MTRFAIAAAGVLSAAIAAGVTRAAEPPGGRHLLYLHGRIVQETQSPRPRHPEYGEYDLEAILQAFRARGFEVKGEIRPKAVSMNDAADRVVEQVRALLAAGVPPGRVTVVGASMGAAIALAASTRLQQPEVRFAALGGCLSEAVRQRTAAGRPTPSGRILAIREKSDELTRDCPAWKDEAAGQGLVAREIMLETGLRHGFLYRPLPEWVDPVVKWAEAP